MPTRSLRVKERYSGGCFLRWVITPKVRLPDVEFRVQKHKENVDQHFFYAFEFFLVKKKR